VIVSRSEARERATFSRDVATISRERVDCDAPARCVDAPMRAHRHEKKCAHLQESDPLLKASSVRFR
tara:strand:+ start:61 stop:261 length:201 start_codon:yes stop_codon:yes gene_type:complete